MAGFFINFEYKMSTRLSLAGKNIKRVLNILLVTIYYVINCLGLGLGLGFRDRVMG